MSNILKLYLSTGSISQHIVGKVVAGIFLCILFFVSSTFAVVDLGGRLANQYNNFQDAQATRQDLGKATISHLYDEALAQAQQAQVASYQQAVQFTTQTLNDQYSCLLQTSDTTNILLYADPAFLSSMQELRLEKNQDATLPTSQEMMASCNKLVVCAQNIPISQYKNSMEAREACFGYISTAYRSALTNQEVLHTLTDDNVGSNVFQNGTLDDSDYDLIVDINNIGKLLFASFKPPVEVLFYRLPTIQDSEAKDRIVTDDDLGNNDGDVIAGGAGRIVDDNDSNTNEDEITDNNNGLSDGLTDNNNNAPNNDIDADVTDFITQTNTIDPNFFQNQSSPIAANQCIVPSSDSLPRALQEETLTPEEYEELLSGFVQENETTDDDEINESIASGDNHVSGAQATGDPQEQIANMIETLASVDDVDADNAARSCMARCDDLPAGDQPICIADCLCGMVTSPPLVDLGNDALGLSQQSDYLIPEGAFRLKFCKIPAETKETNRGKRVFSIEEIFVELRNILINLRDSGQMIKSNKTKEFLDSSVKKNNFGDIFAFNLNVTFKPLFDEVSSQQRLQEKQEVNQQLQATQLGLSSDASLPTAQNKYVVISDIATNQATKQTYKTLGQLEQSIVGMQQLLQGQHIAISYPVVQNAVNRHQALVAEEVKNFLGSNFQFWSEVHTMFTDMVGSAALLYGKIKSAE